MREYSPLPSYHVFDLTFLLQKVRFRRNRSTARTSLNFGSQTHPSGECERYQEDDQEHLSAPAEYQNPHERYQGSRLQSCEEILHSVLQDPNGMCLWGMRFDLCPNLRIGIDREHQSQARVRVRGVSCHAQAHVRSGPDNSQHGPCSSCR